MQIEVNNFEAGLLVAALKKMAVGARSAENIQIQDLIHKLVQQRLAQGGG